MQTRRYYLFEQIISPCGVRTLKPPPAALNPPGGRELSTKQKY